VISIEYLIISNFIGMAICAYTDIKRGLIYNKVLFPLILCSLAFIYFYYPNEFLDSLKWGLITWGITIPMILLGFLGGGDGKLLALVGVLFQKEAITVLLWFLLISLIFFIAIDIYKRKSIKELLYHYLFFKNFSNKDAHYNLGGVFIFLASIIVFLKGWII